MPEEEAQEEGAEGPEGKGQVDAPDVRLVVEGLLFSADRPLRIADIEEATSLDRTTVRRVLRRLASDYRRRNTALEVVKVGSRWTMQVRDEYSTHARAVAAPEVNPRLLRTLALIAYHQPMLQSDLQEMLGPKVYEHVRELVGLGLVSAARQGSTRRLTTTQRFPEYFGIASAKKEDIKRFLADRVGIEVPDAVPPADDAVGGEGAEDAEGGDGSPAPPAEDDQR